MHYVYFMKSKRNDKVYVGSTSKDPKLRTKEHNSGSNRFTRQNSPWKLLYYENFTCRGCAHNREVFLKTGVGKKLRKLIIDCF